MTKKIDLVNEVIKHSIIFDETQKNGDFKKGNKSSKKILKILDQLKQDQSLATEVLDDLLKNDNPAVLDVCCLYAILLNYRRDEALKILKEIAKLGIKVTSFSAEMTIELYESGELFELHGMNDSIIE